MNNFTISIFGNKIFLEIINELKLFPGSRVNFIDNLDLYINNTASNNQIIFFFINAENKKDYLKIKKRKNPIIVITPTSIAHNKYSDDSTEQINMPFKITNFKRRIVSFLAKHEFKLSSLTNAKHNIVYRCVIKYIYIYIYVFVLHHT